MTRLDSAIRRLTAQRDCLNLMAARLEGTAGWIVELGLGNGRTYDHIRHYFENREIFVFERDPKAHPSSTPEKDYLITGDLFETILNEKARFQGKAALVHSDIGCGDPEMDQKLSGFLSKHISSFLTPSGMILSDQPLFSEQLTNCALPDSVATGRYFLYKANAGGTGSN